MYLVISRCADEPHVDLMTEAQVKKSLVEDWEGYKFLAKAPNIEYMGDKCVFLFKGEVVIPKAKSVVTEYEL